MSGPICPDCGSFDIIRADDKTDKCGFCGWMGPSRPRRVLTIETQGRLADENRRNHQLKDEGRLFFLRVHLKEGVPIDAQLMRETLASILGEQKWFKYNEQESYIFLKLDHRPDSGKMKRIEELVETLRVELI